MKVNQLRIQFKAYALLFVSLLFVAVACNNDDEGNPDPSFPKKQELTITQPGETSNIEITANYPWTLTSNRSWCKFVDNDENVSSLQSVAGSYTVTVIITNEAWGFEDQEAILTMGMTTPEGVKTKEIAVISRTAQVYKYTAYGKTEEDVINAEHPLNITWYSHGGSIEPAPFNFTANFDWTIKNYPEWLVIKDDVAISGSATELVTTTCMVSTTVDQRNELSGEIEYADKTGAIRATIPVFYGGYPATKVGFTLPSTAGYKLAYWFDVLGAKYWYLTTDNTIMGETEGAVTVKVAANVEQPLHIVTFAEDINGNLTVLPEVDRWFSASQPTLENDWTISIVANENTGTEVRKVRFLVLTDKVLKSTSIAEKPENLIAYNEALGVTTVKDEYANYVALAFAQEAVMEKTVVFGVANAFRNENYMYEEGEIFDVTALIGTDLEATYGTANVYKCTFTYTDLTNKRLWLTAEFDLNTAFQDGNVNYNDVNGAITTTPNGWTVSPSFSTKPAVILNITKLGTDPMQIRCTINEEVYVLVLVGV